MWAEIGSFVSRDTGSRGREGIQAPAERQLFVHGQAKANNCGHLKRRSAKSQNHPFNGRSIGEWMGFLGGDGRVRKISNNGRDSTVRGAIQLHRDETRWAKGPNRWIAAQTVPRNPGQVRSVKHSTIQNKNGLPQNRRLFQTIQMVRENEEIAFRARLYHEIGRPHDALNSIDALIA
jgi:hypothetical protein